MSMRHSTKGPELNFCSQLFCISSVLCTRGHHSSGNNSSKIKVQTQMLMIRHVSAQVNVESDLISVSFSIVKTIHISII